MPLFGSRIVCKYGNYKYIEVSQQGTPGPEMIIRILINKNYIKERDKHFAEREENLGE